MKIWVLFMVNLTIKKISEIEYQKRHNSLATLYRTQSCMYKSANQETKESKC